MNQPVALLLALTLAASPAKRDTCTRPPKSAATQVQHHRPINPRATYLTRSEKSCWKKAILFAGITGLAGYLIGHDGRETRTITVQAPCPSCGEHHRDCGRK